LKTDTENLPSNTFALKQATFYRIQDFMKDSLDTQEHASPYELPGLWFTPQELTALSLLKPLNIKITP